MSEDKVTLRDVYHAVERLEDKMGERFESVEKDVKDLKDFKSRVIGVASVSGVFGGIVSLITTYIWNKATGQT